ncbi:MAG: hypothetical protein IT445_12120 [Phycisphaeraceae bacterium]|nr:hypothetical protein [Phycisphaeraceae bacterium]
MEQILDTVRSIDEHVDEILDRVSDQFDELSYHRDWRNHGYDLDDEAYRAR